MPAHLDLIVQCKMNGLPRPVAEYRFHPERKWRSDYAFVDYKLAIEIEGGVFQVKHGLREGWHQSISIMLKNMTKYNDYSILGWSLLRFTPGMVNSGEAIRTIKAWFERRANHGEMSEMWGSGRNRDGV